MDSSSIFRAAKKALGMGTIQQIFRRSSPLVSTWAAKGQKPECPVCGQAVEADEFPSERTVQLWAANPRHCGFTANNPIDQTRMLLDEMDTAGRRDEAVWAGNYMVEPLDLRCTPIDFQKSDKGTIDGEAADLLVAAGDLVHKAREYRPGGFDSEERVKMSGAYRRIIRELNQFMDAAGLQPAPADVEDRHAT